MGIQVINPRATEALRELEEVKRNIESNFLALGRLLCEIKDNLYYKAEGYSNFKDFIEAKFDFGWRQGFHLAHIYQKAKALGLEDKLVGKGVSILKDIFSLDKKEDIERLLVLDVPYKEIKEQVYAMKGYKHHEGKEGWQTLFFNCTAGQAQVITEALHRCVLMSNKESRGELLELICADFLSDPNNQANLDDYPFKHILERDAHTCQFQLEDCTRHTQLTAFHIKPLSQGGTNAEDNLITACMSCHLKKEKKVLRRSTE